MRHSHAPRSIARPLAEQRAHAPSMLLVTLLVVAAAGVGPPPGATASAAAARRAAINHPSAPALTFEPNRGQAPPDSAFIAHGRAYSVGLSATGATLTPGRTTPARAATRPDQAVVRMALAGADPAARGQGQDKLPGTVGYIGGRDARGWLTGIPTYAAVRYAGVYPGVDVVYYGAGPNLEYDFRVAPGGDPRRIRLTYAGAAPSLTANGDLILHTQSGDVRQRAPVIYQLVDGARRAVDGGYTLAGRTVGIRVGAYDQRAALVIDPVVIYSTYYGPEGGAGDDRGNGVAVDSQGNAYVVGTTTSGFARSAAFIAKFDSSGTTVLWKQYISDTFGAPPGTTACPSTGGGVAVDGQGNVYMTGMYGGTDEFNLCNAQSVLWLKFDPAGTIVGNQTYGKNGGSKGNAIAVDSQGNSYITGSTEQWEANFPVTPGAFQTVAGISKQPSGCVAGDAFVLKVDANGAIVYGTFLGSCGIDEGLGIAVDGRGDAVVVGTTTGNVNGVSDYPVTTNALQTRPGSWAAPSFMSELNADGSALLYSTFVSGNTGERAAAVAVDARGDIYVTGDTESADFPTTANAYDRTCGNDGLCSPVNSCYYDWGTATNYCHWQNAEDVFVSKFDPRQSGAASLVYSTFLGGLNREMGQAIAVDADGMVYVAGRTASSDFPVRQASQPAFGGTWNSFVAKIDPAKAGDASLVWSTYLGGSGYDEADGLALDAGGNVYVTGFTTSTDFPTRGPLQGANNGRADVFLAKLGPAAPATLATLALDRSALAGAGAATGTVTLTGPAPTGGATVALTSSVPSAASVPATVTVPAGATAATFTVAVRAVPAPTSVTLSASYNGVGASAGLSLAPPPSATPTNTVAPPTATPTDGATPPAPTATRTAIPPLPTATNTTVPPPATATNTVAPRAATATPPPSNPPAGDTTPSSKTPAPPPAATATSHAPPVAPTATPPGPPTSAPSAAPSAPAGGPTLPTVGPGSGRTGAAQAQGQGQGALPLALSLRRATLPAGGTLTLVVTTAANARVDACLATAAMRVTWTGTGARRARHVVRVQVCRATQRGRADHRGRFVVRVRAGVAWPAAARATLTVRAQAGSRTATRAITVSIQARRAGNSGHR